MAPMTIRVGLQVVHRMGIKHNATEALSRLPTPGMEKSALEDEVQVLMEAKGQPKVENRNVQKILAYHPI